MAEGATRAFITGPKGEIWADLTLWTSITAVLRPLRSGSGGLPYTLRAAATLHHLEREWVIRIFHFGPGQFRVQVDWESE
jgi:hypothetical protein